MLPYALVGYISWWRHQMETFSAALLAFSAGNSPSPGEFSTQRPLTRSVDDFFDLRLNKRLSKQSWGWWFETLSRPLWRHCNVIRTIVWLLACGCLLAGIRLINWLPWVQPDQLSETESLMGCLLALLVTINLTKKIHGNKVYPNFFKNVQWLKHPREASYRSTKNDR